MTIPARSFRQTFPETSDCSRCLGTLGLALTTLGEPRRVIYGHDPFDYPLGDHTQADEPSDPSASVLFRCSAHVRSMNGALRHGEQEQGWRTPPNG